MNNDKLALLGLAKNTFRCSEEVFNDGFEIWGMNNLMRILPESWVVASRWFDIHGIGWMIDCQMRGYLSPALYCVATMPVYMVQRIDIFPTSVAYPIKEVCEYFNKPVRFFNSTACLMLALAIYENRFKQINMYGIEMQDREEYIAQRAPFYYLMAKAEDRGVEIVLPKHCKLMEVGRLSELDESYFGMNMGRQVVFDDCPETRIAAKLKRFFV